LAERLKVKTYQLLEEVLRWWGRRMIHDESGR